MTLDCSGTIVNCSGTTVNCSGITVNITNGVFDYEEECGGPCCELEPVARGHKGTGAPVKSATDEDSEARSLNTGKPGPTAKPNKAAAKEDYDEETEEISSEEDGRASTIATTINGNVATELTIDNSTLAE